MIRETETLSVQNASYQEKFNDIDQLNCFVDKYMNVSTNALDNARNHAYQCDVIAT